MRARLHPSDEIPVLIVGEVMDKGEIQFNRERLHQATAWISANPQASASLTWRRFVRFWFPYLGGFRYAIPTSILTVFSFVGLALMFWNQSGINRRAALILAAPLLLYPLVHDFVQFEARYRYPIFWATFLPAAYAILECINCLRKAPEPGTNAPGKQNQMVAPLR
jgi:hypothetical protein